MVTTSQIITIILIFALYIIIPRTSQVQENLLVIYIILLLGCVGCNIMALRNPISFNNMILNGAFDIQGSFYNNSNSTFSFVKNFDNQNEFLDLINNGDNIFHFDKCEKI